MVVDDRDREATGSFIGRGARGGRGLSGRHEALRSYEETVGQQAMERKQAFLPLLQRFHHAALIRSAQSGEPADPQPPVTGDGGTGRQFIGDRADHGTSVVQDQTSL